MKFAFFGTPSVASLTLESLIRAGYVPSVVVTAPDAPRGRGMIVSPTPTKEVAVRYDIPVITPQILDDTVVHDMQERACEYAVVVAYGKIIPQVLIDTFARGILNIHYSLLPQYRGASPVETALLHGATETGVTIQRMVYRLDAGDIIASERTLIESHETARELRARLIRLGADLLIRTLPAFETGTVLFTPQDESLATHCGKIHKNDGLLDITGNAEKNWNTYRAYAESPGTYFYMPHHTGPIRIKIKTAHYDGTHFIPLRVIPEGKKEMDYKIFLNSI